MSFSSEFLAIERDETFENPFTDYDYVLVDRELDFEDLQTDSRLIDVPTDKEIDAAIDAIYIAADSGNNYAKFLLLVAAANQSGYFEEKGYDAQPLEFEPIDVAISTYISAQDRLDRDPDNRPIYDPEKADEWIVSELQRFADKAALACAEQVNA